MPTSSASLAVSCSSGQVTTRPAPGARWSPLRIISPIWSRPFVDAWLVDPSPVDPSPVDPSPVAAMPNPPRRPDRRSDPPSQPATS
jgi:hypothetical protein